MTQKEKYELAQEIFRLKVEKKMGFEDIAKELGISSVTAHRYFEFISSGKVNSAEDMPMDLRSKEEMEGLAEEMRKGFDEGKTISQMSRELRIPKSSLSYAKSKYIDKKTVFEAVTSEINRLVKDNPESAGKVEKLINRNPGMVEVEISSGEDQSKCISVKIDYPDISDQDEFLKEFGRRVFSKLKLRPVFPWTKIPLED